MERNNEVVFTHHGPCPECGSRDNLGHWSDGHSYCFGCGYYRRGTEGFESVKRSLSVKTEGGIPPLPDDVSTYVPDVPYAWLKKWLSDEEILSHRIGWSQEKECVVFPVFDPDGTLLMWQSRYFGSNKSYPKYLTKGYKGDILHVLGGHSTGRVILVEDLISAIVVSRVENSMPLWGSTVHLKTLKRLSQQYESLGIWLDADKLSEAVKAQGPARLLFRHVEVIFTEQDPKYMNLDQLQEKLGKPIDKRDQP
jgi:Zn ribbon nucleic-acid-binding protein